MRVLFVQHDHVSPPGPVGERFAERGYGVEEFLVVPADRFHAPGVTVSFPDPTTYDALVVMGAVWSAYDHHLVGSWVLPELELLRTADATGVPVFGICFGGQMLAAAHGGAVQRADEHEIGWHQVDSDDPEIVAPGPWFQWHFDRWTTPPGAQAVARNRAAPQAFVLRRNLAVQFHPELDLAMLQGWLANGGTAELARLGYDEPTLVAQTQATATTARERTHRLVDSFLDRVATAALG